MADLISMLSAASGATAEADPNFKQTVLLLHGDGTNGAQNNTFLDSSTNNFTITRNGNTTQGTFSPFSLAAGEWSNYFDGTDDYLSVADNAVLRPGAGAFTLEAWIYRNASGAAHTVYAKGGASTGIVFQVTSGNVLRFTHTTTNIDSTGTVAANAWVHVAVVREGTGTNQTKLYINGVQDGQGTVSTDFTQTEEVRIGTNRGATDDFAGYISNVRFVKGSALYTAGFTPSTVPLTTTSQGASSSEVELLTCQSNRFVDNSTNAFAITRNGDVRVTPFSPFAPTAAYSAGTNGGSGYFDGSGDYLTAAAASDWTFLHNGSDWTCEFWLYHTGTSLYGIVSTTAFSTQTGMSILVNNTNNSGLVNGLQVYIVRGVSASEAVFNSTALLAINQWNYVAITFTSSTKTCAFTINGASAGSSSNTGFSYSASNPTNTLAIARYQGTTPGGDLPGYIASLRISTNVRTGLTSVPTAPYTSDANTKLLCNFTNAGIIDNTGKNNLETVGNAQIDTTTKKYGTGSLEFDGTGDYLIVPNSTELDFGSGNFTLEFWINFNSLSGAIGIIGKRAAEGNFSPFLMEVSSSTLKLYISTSGSSWAVSGLSTSTLSTGTWYHIAAVRSGTTVYLFLNGTSVGSTGTATGALMTNTTPVTIGLGSLSTIVTVPLNGYIDDLRITKGVARYTANFTAPTKAFPDL